MPGTPADLEAVQRAHDAHVAGFLSFSSIAISHLLNDLVSFDDNFDLLRTSAAHDPIAVVSAEVTCPSRVLSCTELEIDRVDEARGDPFGIQARATGWFDRGGSIVLSMWCDFLRLFHLILIHEGAINSIFTALCTRRAYI